MYRGPWGHRPPKSCPGPPFFQGKAESMMISIVIPLSRSCLPNDEGPAPKIFFPRTATADCSKYGLGLRRVRPPQCGGPRAITLGNFQILHANLYIMVF